MYAYINIFRLKETFIKGRTWINAKWMPGTSWRVASLV